MVVGRNAAELRVGHLAEHAGDHEHGHEREAEQPDGHHRLAEQSRRLDGGRAGAAVAPAGAVAGWAAMVMAVIGVLLGQGDEAVLEGGALDARSWAGRSDRDEVGADVGEQRAGALHGDLGPVAVDPARTRQVAERRGRRGPRR